MNLFYERKDNFRYIYLRYTYPGTLLTIDTSRRGYITMHRAKTIKHFIKEINYVRYYLP